MSFERVEIGDHVLYRGDANEVIDSLDVAMIDALVTDPPYEITAVGAGIAGKRQYFKDIEGFTDCGFDYSLLGRFKNWMCFGTLRQVPKMIEAAGDRRWMLITWNKSNPCPLVNGNYLPDTEYIVHAWSAGCLFGAYKDKARFVFHPLGDKEHGEHPNEKPVKIMSKCVRLAADAGGVILDPFMGSGTTGVACLHNRRLFIGVERERRWFDVACKRIEFENGNGSLFADDCKWPAANLFAESE